MEGKRAEAEVMPGAVKYKGTEGGTTGHCCSSGWEYMRKESMKSCICQVACELCTCWVCVWQRKECWLCLAGRVTVVCPLVVVLLLSSGHVYESQIIRSELSWARAPRNWLYRWLMSAVKSVTWPEAPAVSPSNLAELQRNKRSPNRFI